MGIESPGKKSPEPGILSSLSRDELLARALKAENPDELKKINDALGALKEEGALKREPEEKTAYKEVKIEKAKNARIVVKSGEHYVIGKARNAIIAVEPGGKVTIEDATNVQVFQPEGASVQITQQRNVMIHTGKEAINGVRDLGGNPKKNREEKPTPAGEARREEPKQAQIKEEYTIAPSGDGTESADAMQEAAEAPRARPHEKLLEEIYRASQKGDAQEVARLNELLHGSPKPTPEAKEPDGGDKEEETHEVQEPIHADIIELIKDASLRGDIEEVRRLNALLHRTEESPQREAKTEATDAEQEPPAPPSPQQGEVVKDQTEEKIEEGAAQGPAPDATPTPPEQPEPRVQPAPEPPPSEGDKEPKDEKPQEAQEGQAPLETRFRDSFGIAPQELQRIPGYRDLSEGQKEMVFENLRQATLGRIQEEAGKAYRANTAQAKFFGRIWQGASKRYQIAKLEKEHAEEFSYAGLEAHEKILEKLVQGAKEGPEAVRNKDGTLDIRFVSEKTLEGLAGGPLPESAKKSAEEFNSSSSLFARIPHEWSLSSASRGERKKYEAAKKRYETARGSLLQEMDHANGRRRALEDALALDQKVQMNQFLTANPDVEQELQKIESKHLWARALANTITEKGIYALFGTVSRTAAVGMLGAIGAPLAAAGMGGFVARGRAKETLREEARLARKGAGKTFEAVKSTGERVRRESRDYVKAEVLAKRIDSLIYKSHIYGPKGDLAAQQLDRLLKYSDAKLKDGLINFGAREEGIKNQFELIKELGMARAGLAARNGKSETHARLEAVLRGRKEKISAKEKKYVRSQILKGALLAGGFASAGRAVAEYFYSGDRPSYVLAAPDEEAEIGHEIKKATGAEMRGIAPPETPLATPDEEAEIGRAIKKATGAELKGSLEFTPEQLTETVKSGDSVWKIAERKLEELYGTKFTELDPARKTYVIDAVKDEIAKNPEKFGLENADKIKIGQTINFSGILNDKERVADVFARANDLDDAVRESIVKNNKLIADWAHDHPREALTSERVEEILRAKPGNAETPTDYGHDSGPLQDENYYHGVSLPEVEAYGSREGAFFGKLAGLSDIEYRVIRGQTVGKILAEIPSRAEAEAIYQGGIPGRTIELPYLEQYDRNEFEGHIRLAELIRHYIEQNPNKEYFMDMEVDDFFKVAAPEEGPVFRGAAGSELIEPEEFAQNPVERAQGKFAQEPYSAEYTPPVERAPGKFVQEPYTAEFTPRDEFVGATKISGEDIRKFGSAAEAFIAKERLGMVPQEWMKIKSVSVQELLKETPDGGHAMDEETLSRWYESRRPALPEEYRFLSFKRYAILADAFRTMLAGHTERAYLEELPVGELAKIFVLQTTK